MECVLCNCSDSGVIYQTQLFRIVIVDEEMYPGFVRLILNSHIKEMSDLSIKDGLVVFTTLLKIEKIIREIYNPDKINLASLGNITPHLHWHIIPRFYNDRHYPNPIWGDTTHPEYIPSVNLCKLESSLSLKLQHILAN